MPKFFVGRPVAVVLCAMQLGCAFMSADALAVNDEPGIWEVTGFIVLSTIILAFTIADLAMQKGQPWEWGLLAPLSFIGLVVVLCLPDRSGDNSPRGFEVQLVVGKAER